MWGLDRSKIVKRSTDANHILRNSVSFEDPVGISVGGVDNRVEGNTVSQTAGVEPGGAGIWVNGAGTLVRGNVSNNNGDDGIRVLSPGVTLTANTTNWNVDLGIQAVDGVRDGGRNTAFGNGNPLQCLNVVCK
jgi:hypothetical protein